MKSGWSHYIKVDGMPVLHRLLRRYMIVTPHIRHRITSIKRVNNNRPLFIIVQSSFHPPLIPILSWLHLQLLQFSRYVLRDTCREKDSRLTAIYFHNLFLSLRGKYRAMASFRIPKHHNAANLTLFIVSTIVLITRLLECFYINS